MLAHVQLHNNIRWPWVLSGGLARAEASFSRRLKLISP